MTGLIFHAATNFEAVKPRLLHRLTPSLECQHNKWQWPRRQARGANGHLEEVDRIEEHRLFLG
jgi:hypothetical protein